MNDVKFKICGITERTDIRGIVELNPDFLGFIFFSGSPRNILNRVDIFPFSLIPERISKVAVFVNAKTSTIEKITQRYSFGYVQLHGNEKPEQCKEIKCFAKVIKAFRISNTLPHDLKRYEDSCDYFLFDSYGNNFGGNGVSFNHDMLLRYDLAVPFFLSGGIGLDNYKCLSYFKHSRLFAIDVNSKFEIEPGLKDVNKLNQFLNKMRYYDYKAKS